MSFTRPASDILSHLEQVASPEDPAFEGSVTIAHPGMAAISLGDNTDRRVLGSALEQLGLSVHLLQPGDFASADLRTYELVLTSPALARQAHNRLGEHPLQDAAAYPAVVSICAPDQDAGAASGSDAAITLPQDPAALLAQLSVILYAHRAFARRYQSAMEELRLNRRIFRSVTSGISVADVTKPDMPLTYVNPAFEVMTGYSLEEVVGRNCRFLQRNERDQPGVALLRKAIANQEQTTAVLRNFRRDGTSFWNELVISPIRNRDGELTHYVGIQNDVTARMEFEAALRQSEKLAAVNRLAATMAHEINNPLESVMNLLFLAQHETDPERLKHYISEADNEVRRIAVITTESLRFYRQSTRPRAVDCDDLLTSVLDLYAPKLSRFNIEVVHHRRAHAPVVCLESEVRQVVSNMVRNAIDAMRADAGRLEVRTRVRTDWKSGLRGVALTFADTGTGMSADVLRKLFTPFFTTKGDAGTGLGLWVSSNIVERHRGHIAVRSSQNPRWAGTVFTVFLPFDGVREMPSQDSLLPAAESLLSGL